MRSGTSDAYRGKRAVDLIGAACLLGASAPVMVVTALSIALDDGMPVIYKQWRVGRDGSLFQVYKFRSMRRDTPLMASAVALNPPVTRVGRIIRRLNIDELPQLFNVIQGEMSLVGPRPALPSQERLLHLRTTNASSRLRPGMTGLAQLRSYDGMPEDEKAALDGLYAQGQSLRTDISLLLGTLHYLRQSPPTY